LRDGRKSVNIRAGSDLSGRPAQAAAEPNE
jgi:hypothetical protein